MRSSTNRADGVERWCLVTVMVDLQLDAVLGDTNSCMSVIGAKRLNIPILYLEVGNRCKDECLLEEINHYIVDRAIVIPNSCFEKKLYSMYLDYFLQ